MKYTKIIGNVRLLTGGKIKLKSLKAITKRILEKNQTSCEKKVITKTCFLYTVKDQNVHVLHIPFASSISTMLSKLLLRDGLLNERLRCIFK